MSTVKQFFRRHYDLIDPYNVADSRLITIRWHGRNIDSFQLLDFKFSLTGPFRSIHLAAVLKCLVLHFSEASDQTSDL